MPLALRIFTLSILISALSSATLLSQAKAQAPAAAPALPAAPAGAAGGGGAVPATTAELGSTGVSTLPVATGAVPLMTQPGTAAANIDVNNAMRFGDVKTDVAIATAGMQTFDTNAAMAALCAPPGSAAPPGTNWLGLVGPVLMQANAMLGYKEDPEMTKRFEKRKLEEAGAALSDYYNSKVDPNKRMSGNCQNKFLAKDGKSIGEFGRMVQSEMAKASEPSIFRGGKSFADANQLCKGYGGFDQKQRELFWIYFWGALAEPESSCRPEAENRNPDVPAMKYGQGAVGLYQLEPRVCPGMSNDDLRTAHRNITCAVRILNEELQCRDTLMAPHSNKTKRAIAANDCGTYWGPLRSRTRHAGDSKGAQTFKTVLSKFPGCA